MFGGPEGGGGASIHFDILVTCLLTRGCKLTPLGQLCWGALCCSMTPPSLSAVFIPTRLTENDELSNVFSFSYNLKFGGIHFLILVFGIHLLALKILRRSLRLSLLFLESEFRRKIGQIIPCQMVLQTQRNSFEREWANYLIPLGGHLWLPCQKIFKAKKRRI